MNVEIIKGKHTDECIKKCYHILISLYLKQLKEKKDK